MDIIKKQESNWKLVLGSFLTWYLFATIANIIFIIVGAGSTIGNIAEPSLIEYLLFHFVILAGYFIYVYNASVDNFRIRNLIISFVLVFAIFFYVQFFQSLNLRSSSSEFLVNMQEITFITPFSFLQRHWKMF